MSHNFLLISAMHSFKTRGRFLFCSCAKDQVRTQSDSRGWLGQSSRPPEWFSWCISMTSHISLLPHIPSLLQAMLSAPAEHLAAHRRRAGRARASWQGQIQHMGFPGTAWIGGIHPSAALTTPNRQSHNILIVHPGEKQPPSGHKRKNMYGHSWPNMCFVWSATLPRKMWHSAKKPRHSNKTL